MIIRLSAVALSVLALHACAAPLELAKDDSDIVLARQTIDAPNPGMRGNATVRQLYYGSGTDRNRVEYRDSVAFKTTSVDASKFVDLGTNAKMRNKYWGFTPKAMPINARVWYPEGNGPFPLVLLVHGNHDMKDFSDPGYGYLGELLASRGYIFASVDMNFINGAISGENDARGWFLLKHVEAFSKFNETEGNPFHRKVDMQRIALIGHSRGGEAVGHAAAFNRLKHYPDDANVTFDFNYNIRGIIAIAPVDGQYRPSQRFVPLRDVDYLVFHGSHDGDVSSFGGLRQYQRLTFSPNTSHFKSAVYVYRANHGQWNTVWGAHDNGPRSPRILDLRGLMPAEDQRKFAEVYISSFLEASLRGDKRYLPLFQDHRSAGGWLPKTMYITRYHDSSYQPIATFEEDVDLTTTTVRGVTLSSDSLGSWKEGALNLRTSTNPTDASLQNYAAWVGWNNRIEGETDSTRLATPAAFTISIDSTARRTLGIDARSTIELQLLPVDGQPAARKPPKKDDPRQDSAVAAARKAAPKPAAADAKKKKEKPAIDLSVEVTDANGVRASVPLSNYGAIRHPLEMSILRRKDREKVVYPRLYETVLQSYSIPLADLRAVAPRLDPRRITTVRLLFDRAPAGTVIVDEIGFARR